MAQYAEWVSPVRGLPGVCFNPGVHGYPTAMRPATDQAGDTAQAQSRHVHRIATKLTGYWDTTQEKVPAPILRILLTLPWLLRRVPVPPWVAIVLILVRRHRRKVRRRAAAAAAATATATPVVQGAPVTAQRH